MLGKVHKGEIFMNELGQIVIRVWNSLPDHYPLVILDEFCVMPNHFHGIIILTRRGESETRPYKAAHQKRHGLPEIVRALKSFSSRNINQWRDSTGAPVWQRNYYESIIRHERQLNAIRQYIQENPINWEMDMDNPKYL